MDTWAVILAAGRGSKVAPFDRVRPKALLPVAGTTLFGRLLSQLAGLDIQGTTVVAPPAFDGALRAAVPQGAGVEIRVQTEPRGTADAVLVGARSVPEKARLLVLYGDCLFDGRDLQALAAPLDGGARARVLAAAVAPGASREHVCIAVEGGRVTGFWGHPRQGAWRAAGAFVLAPSLRRCLDRNPGRGVRVEVGGMPPLERDLCESLNLAIDEGARIDVLDARGRTVDLDKPWHILEANRVAVQEVLDAPDGVGEPVSATHPKVLGGGRVIAAPGAHVEDGVVVRGRLFVGPDSVVRQGAIFEGDVYLDRDVRVEDYAKVENCAIGPHSVVSHCAEILGGVLMRNVWLMHHCELYGVFGDSVDIGAGTVCGTLRFDDGETPHRVLGRWETPSVGANAVYVGDHSRTGVHATILPGRHIGPYSAIGPAVVVANDVPANTLVTVRQDLETRTFGPGRYGW